MTGQLLQIGEVAERVGLSLRTVRYYEEMGLIAPADRTEGGFRLYTEDHVERLALIKRMKPLGFTVHEMRDLLEARDVLAGDDSSDEARDGARGRLRDFSTAAAKRIDQLRRQLAGAEELAAQLRNETRRRSTPAAARD